MAISTQFCGKYCPGERVEPTIILQRIRVEWTKASRGASKRATIPDSSGCGYASCAPFGTGRSLYLDCDGNAANGCESSPSAPSTCGSCGTQCGAAFTCDEGSPGAYSCVHE